MEYYQLKAPHGFCPKCARPLDLLVPAEDLANTGSFYLCFKCKTVHQFGHGRLTRRQNPTFLKDDQRQQDMTELVKSIPHKHRYAAEGSQVHLKGEAKTPQRQWLSLAEYERIFQTAPPKGNRDFRQDNQRCKWCASALSGQRRSFCRDSCSRNYGKATFFKRTMAALPYRIACRDLFYCQISGLDLALTNKFGQRLPAPGAQLEVHHLIHVADGGTDHERNLVTLSRDVHRDYHRGDPDVVLAMAQLKAQRLKTAADLMKIN